MAEAPPCDAGMRTIDNYFTLVRGIGWANGGCELGLWHRIWGCGVGIIIGVTGMFSYKEG